MKHQKASFPSIRYGVPEGSVLGQLLLLLYINNLNKAVVHSKLTVVHHFADDKNFLYASQSFRYLNQTINFDHFNIV